MEHTRNYLTANVQSFKVMLQQKVKKHDLQAGFTYKIERVKEKTREYEMRDSSGYSIPHTGKDLNMIYTLDARNELRANRIEVYAQDTYKFTSPGENTFYTLNYDHDVTLRLATGLYYQAPFFKELRDTMTLNGITYATLNERIKSQRSIHFIAGYDQRFKMLGRPFKFTAEAYFKLLSNLVPYTVNNVKIVYDASEQCSGHAAGLDLKLYGEFVPGSDSWLTFSLMDTKMRINGKSIPLPTDQRWAVNLFFTDYFPGTDRWKMSLKLAFADGLPFGAPHRSLDQMPFRAPAYKRADIGMSFRAYGESKIESPYPIVTNTASRKRWAKNVWVGIDCLNLFGINNVNSYYWITDVTSQQYAVPNYLTGRQVNLRVLIEL